MHSEANLSQTAQKREKKNIIIFLVPIRDMVKRDAVTKLHGIISMYINVIVIQSWILPLTSMEEKKIFIAALCHKKTDQPKAMPNTTFVVQFQDAVFANSGENAHGKLIASWQFFFHWWPKAKIGSKEWDSWLIWLLQSANERMGTDAQLSHWIGYLTRANDRRIFPWYPREKEKRD